MGMTLAAGIDQGVAAGLSRATARRLAALRTPERIQAGRLQGELVPATCLANARHGSTRSSGGWAA